MNPQMERFRGRPERSRPKLDRSKILATALDALESGQADFSMRGIAASLAVDPMALYHYFSSKQALMEALVDHVFKPLDRLPTRMKYLDSREERLYMLASTYLRCVAALPHLTRYLARRGGGDLARRFAALFELASGSSMAPESPQSAAHDVMVDYLHGAALGGPKAAKRALTAGWPILMRGLMRSWFPA